MNGAVDGGAGYLRNDPTIVCGVLLCEERAVFAAMQCVPPNRVTECTSSEEPNGVRAILSTAISERALDRGNSGISDWE